VLAGVFVTALYSFRMYFLVFHGKERMDEHAREHLHETPAVVTVPLVLLAIPSMVVGWMFVEPMLYGGHYGGSIVVHDHHDVLTTMAASWHGAGAMVTHAFVTAPFWLALGGFVVAWFLWFLRPDIPARIAEACGAVHTVLTRKYYFDDLYESVLAALGRGVGGGLWQVGDVRLIDGLMVNGSARGVGWLSGVVRRIQTGLLYHYAFAMILGLLLLVSLFVMVRL
jgi:NADH-quinone oxidoreductase subunit L